MEKFLSLVLPGNAIKLQQVIIQFQFYYLLSGNWREVKTKKN